MFLTGSAAASGIAWINGIGNLGGFFGPTAVGWIKTMTGSFSSGLYLLAGMAVVSAVSTFWLDIKNPVAERELAGVPAEYDGALSGPRRRVCTERNALPRPTWRCFAHAGGMTHAGEPAEAGGSFLQ